MKVSPLFRKIDQKQKSSMKIIIVSSFIIIIAVAGLCSCSLMRQFFFLSLDILLIFKITIDHLHHKYHSEKKEKFTWYHTATILMMMMMNKRRKKTWQSSIKFIEWWSSKQTKKYGYISAIYFIRIASIHSFIKTQMASGSIMVDIQSIIGIVIYSGSNDETFFSGFHHSISVCMCVCVWTQNIFSKKNLEHNE